MRPYVDDLLAQARRLLAAHSAREVLALTGQGVRRLAGVPQVFASLATAATWRAGEHLRIGADVAEATLAERSALFAVHRAVVARPGGPVVFAGDELPTVVDALCGGGRAARLLAFPLSNPRGRLSGFVALCTDVEPAADVVAALAELVALATPALGNAQRIASARRDRERLNLLAEAAEEALWDWQPDTGEFWWGGGMRTLLGDVAVQSRLAWKFEHVHPDDAARVRASFDAALADPVVETWREEYRQQRADGSFIRVEDHAHILRDSAGRVHRVVGALRDVTELRALLAREHAARAEAERANLAKDEFLAMLGHELRNPLSPIVSALHLLRGGTDAATTAKALTILERQAGHLTRLVDDLLDVARIAKGKVHLERERMDLAVEIDSAIEAAMPLIEQRGHVVRTDVERPLTIDGDRARMRQVVANLMTNAAKYTPPGGRIVVAGRVDDGHVVVTVRDTGIGIAAEMLPRIFDTFVQGRQEIDRTRGGLGLGLAIVRNLVELHGGTVAARSDGAGGGAEFELRVPVAAATAATVPAPPPVDATPVARRRILVVDDNQDAAEFLAQELQVFGHDAHVVHDGSSALAFVAANDPDVVLLDLGLPVMDGYEVARQLRGRHGPDRPRLVAVTGYGQDADRRRSHEAGFDEHLVKPVPFERLHEAIRAAAASPGEDSTMVTRMTRKTRKDADRAFDG